MAGIKLEVQPAVGKVTIDLSLDEALYVAGVLGNSSQFHPTLSEWFPLHTYEAETVWDTIMDALRNAGIEADAVVPRTGPWTSGRRRSPDPDGRRIELVQGPRGPALGPGRW